MSCVSQMLQGTSKAVPGLTGSAVQSELTFPKVLLKVEVPPVLPKLLPTFVELQSGQHVHPQLVTGFLPLLCVCLQHCGR